MSRAEDWGDGYVCGARDALAVMLRHVPRSGWDRALDEWQAVAIGGVSAYPDDEMERGRKRTSGAAQSAPDAGTGGSVKPPA